MSFRSFVSDHRGFIGGSILGGPIGGFIGESFDKQRKSEADIAAGEAGIKNEIAGIPRYQISPEIQQMLKQNEAAAASLDEQKGLTKEATDISRGLAGMGEAPGSSLAREDIRQSTASSVQNAMEAGGGTAALGAISKLGLNEQMALRDLARSNQQFRTQSEQDLSNALRSEAGMNAQITGQQSALRNQGYQAMTNERQMQYESDLNKYLTGVQFDTQMLSNRQMELENMKVRRAQLLSSGMQAVSSIAPSLIPK